MINEVSKLLVKYNGVIVGYLINNEGVIAFQYDDEWIEKGFSISPFSLPLNNSVYIAKNKNFDGLFGVFNDSLPDGWGNLLLRRKLSQVGIDYDKLSPLTKLSLVSSNGLGGLSYEPVQFNGEKINHVDLDKYALESEKLFILSQKIEDIDSFISLGGSSGGSRPKIHIKDNEGEWIIKFPCSLDIKEIGYEEFISNRLAELCGIKTNEYKLFDSKIYKGYFGAKRFDRIKDKRIHMISLSSLLETTHIIPNLDYSHLFQVIAKISVNRREDIQEAYKRMCFNVLYGNKDDHGKNFAFIYDENKKGYCLSPFYDITKSHHKVEHEMTVNGNGRPTEKDLLEMAKKLELSFGDCEKVINHIKEILKNQNSLML